jgi:hypothetical protein
LTDEFWAGLWFTIIFWLLFSSVMTLYVTPSLYYSLFLKEKRRSTIDFSNVYNFIWKNKLNILWFSSFIFLVSYIIILIIFNDLSLMDVVVQKILVIDFITVLIAILVFCLFFIKIFKWNIGKVLSHFHKIFFMYVLVSILFWISSIFIIPYFYFIVPFLLFFPFMILKTIEWKKESYFVLLKDIYRKSIWNRISIFIRVFFFMVFLSLIIFILNFLFVNKIMILIPFVLFLYIVFAFIMMTFLWGCAIELDKKDNNTNS